MKQYKFKHLVLATIIGSLISGGIGVAAVTIKAEQIKYTPSNENFTATNAKEAFDEIYKIANYEIPADTYFYDSSISGDEIVRYKKVDGKYYLCDKNGKITSEIEQDISDLKLVEYTHMEETNLTKGKAGYSNEVLYLGDGSDNTFFESLSNLNITQIAQRQHGASGGTYSYTHTINNANDYKYLLVLLSGVSNVETSNGSDTRAKNSISVSSGNVKTLVNKYQVTNGSANHSVGLYLIEDYSSEINISVYTSASAIEYIYGIK